MLSLFQHLAAEWGPEADGPSLTTAILQVNAADKVVELKSCFAYSGLTSGLNL